jgi:hypothetical protein
LPSQKPKRKHRSNQPPVWFRQFGLRLENFIKYQTKFNKAVMKRLDRIVKLNNLKE